MSLADNTQPRPGLRWGLRVRRGVTLPHLNPNFNPVSSISLLIAWSRCALFCLAALASPASPLSLSPFFGSDMVLPCDTPFAVAGEAAPGATVSVRAGTHPERQTRADADGRWRVALPACPPSMRPHDLTARSGVDTVVCTNVLFGDLWVCAGQSNMEWPLRACDTAAAATAAATDDGLRHLHLFCRLPTANKAWDDALLALAKTPQAFGARWGAVTPQTAPALSGVGVLFGQALRSARPGVPLGLVQLAVGGAPVEAFTPADPAARNGWLDAPASPAPWCQTRAKANLARALGSPGLADLRHPFEPGLLYDRAVAPLAALLPVRGVLWYQGESNATDGAQPDTALDPEVMRGGLAALITGWRRAWARDDLPFVLIQLPRMDRPWMLFREQQALAAQTFPHVGLVITTDTGEPKNVHPRDKAPVAVRAAGEALRVAYRDPAAPAFTYGVSASGAAGRVTVRFTPGHRLAVKGETLKGFDLSADGSAFVPARAALLPDQTVRVSADGLPTPLAVRYNWSPVPQGNLYNAAGLPVGPFRLNVQ